MATVLTALAPVDGANARQRGITGYSGNPGTNRGATCTQCHSGGRTPDVALEGPTRVYVGTTHEYTLTITGGQRTAGGLDVSVTSGELDVHDGAQDVQIVDREVTHTEPKRSEQGGGVVFRFLWTAPRTPGRARMYGAGNSINLNGSPLGDAPDADDLSVTVEEAPPTPMPPPTVESPYPVLAAGLANPHGLTVLERGLVLVGEGGSPGAQAAPGQFSPGAGDGRIVRIEPDATDEPLVVVDGLTNAVDPGGGVVGGNHAIPVPAGTGTDQGGAPVLVAQAGGPGHLRPEDAAKILLVATDGTVSELADTLEYERQHNPDGGEGIDSNPWRIVLGPDGRAYVVDAGANAVLALDLTTKALSTWAVFTDFADGQQAIPTGLAFSSTDANVAYVSLLGPFGPGTTEIRRLEDGNGDSDVLDAGENTVLVGGLKLVTDLVMGTTEHLLFTQLDGTLWRLDPSCWAPETPCDSAAAAVVADRLPGASGLALMGNGDALVATTDGPAPDGLTFTTNLIVRVPAALLVPTPTATASAAASPSPTPDGSATPSPSSTSPPTPTRTPASTPTQEPNGWPVFLPRVVRGP